MARRLRRMRRMCGSAKRCEALWKRSADKLTRWVSASPQHNLARVALHRPLGVCPVFDIPIARDFCDDRRRANNLEQRVGLWAHEEFDGRERRRQSILPHLARAESVDEALPIS